ncbi:MAG TPA: CNNM domain-containing protein, partial [Gammaproteobacteria bacterium]|nr:CNNM domain-containing protein [Gammaproteobacteria bacterium]
MLDEIPIGVLIGVLVFLIILSGFFSGSETGLISLNRYRLRHLAREGNRGAIRADRLLQRTDRLIGIILLGNNFVNILASALATVIAIRVLGEAGLLVATLGLTVVILIFAEVAPKTLAALHPERFAFPASFILGPLLKAFYPLVWTINTIANALLRLFGVSPDTVPSQHLTTEELRTVVNEAGAMIPQRHQKMLLNLLDLEKSTVEAIMVPRHEIDGVNLEDDWEEVVEQLANSQHTRLPVYRGGVDHVVGVVHVRNVLALQRRGELTPEDLERILKDPYFIPEGTPLNTQLLNFQRNQRRIGLVVDEYGDIQGLATLD